MTKPQPRDDAGTDSKPSRDQQGQRPRGLVIPLGGVGGLDWCGIALRRVLKVQRLPSTSRSSRGDSDLAAGTPT